MTELNCESRILRWPEAATGSWTRPPTGHPGLLPAKLKLLKRQRGHVARVLACQLLSLGPAHVAVLRPAKNYW